MVTKANISITVDWELLKRFKRHCEKNAFKVSSRVAFLMARDMSENLFVKDVAKR